MWLSYRYELTESIMHLDVAENWRPAFISKNICSSVSFIIWNLNVSYQPSLGKDACVWEASLESLGPRPAGSVLESRGRQGRPGGCCLEAVSV